MADLFKEEVQLNGAGVTVQLSKAGLLRWSGKRKNGTLMIPGDLIGFKEQQEDASSIILHTFCHCSSSSSMSHKLCGPRRGGGRRNRIRKDMLIKFANPASHKLFCDNIQEFLDACGRPKKLLVIVNPFGGDGVGRRVYMKTVEPLLQAAGITIIMKETQFQQHAKELAKSFNLSEIDGIVCVSGDGVLVEVLNGLLERLDWESAIKVPLGIVPAGTGNGMAKSVLNLSGEPCDAATATFAIIQGMYTIPSFQDLPTTCVHHVWIFLNKTSVF
jgi:sphingosine kinase